MCPAPSSPAPLSGGSDPAWPYQDLARYWPTFVHGAGDSLAIRAGQSGDKNGRHVGRDNVVFLC